MLCADCLPSSHQIENVDACLSFLDARGVNVQGLSAEGKNNTKFEAWLNLIKSVEQQKRDVAVVFV